MIISHSQKFIFISIPRTASSSIRKWLTSHPELECEQDDENPHSLSGGRYPDYHRWTVVRNPYDRAVSLWRYYRDTYPYKSTHLPGPLPLTFFQFAELQQVKHLVLSWWFYSVNQVELLENERIDSFVRFESLERDLYGLPFELPHTPLSRLEPTRHDPWRDYYDQTNESLIWEWAREDFERFGYPRLVVRP